MLKIEDMFASAARSQMSVQSIIPMGVKVPELSPRLGFQVCGIKAQEDVGL